MQLFIQLLVSGIVIGCVYGLIGLGYSLIYKASGLMNFAQGDILTWGAFVGVTYFRILKIPFIPSLFLTVFTIFCIGMLFQRVIIRNMVNRHAPLFLILLATIAMSMIFRNGAQFIWGYNPLMFPTLIKSVPVVKILGIQFQTEAVVCIGIAVITMILLRIFISKTKFGTAMRAVALNPMAAEACGINVTLNVSITWGISAAIAGLAGMLLGPIYGVYTSLGTSFGRKGFAGAILGGYGNMIGAVLGGLILGIAESFISGYVSSTYKNLFVYGLLLLTLFVKPTGLLNERTLQE